MVRDIVVAVLDRDRLSGALATIHQSGLGHNARVLDGARGNLAAQARSANIPDDVDILSAVAGDVLVVVHAAARSAVAAEILSRAGARAVYLVARDQDRQDSSPRPASAAASTLITPSEADGSAPT